MSFESQIEWTQAVTMQWISSTLQNDGGRLIFFHNLNKNIVKLTKQFDKKLILIKLKVKTWNLKQFYKHKFQNLYLFRFYKIDTFVIMGLKMFW